MEKHCLDSPGIDVQGNNIEQTCTGIEWSGQARERRRKASHSSATEKRGGEQLRTAAHRIGREQHCVGTEEKCREASCGEPQGKCWAKRWKG
jgi:hypothetical protein